MNPLISNITEQENLHVSEIQPLSGGDINEVYLCHSTDGPIIIKANDADRYPRMFSKEADGLEALRKSKCFQIPLVIAIGEVGNHAYLILEYLPPEPVKNWSAFGEQLAQLHQCSAPAFGFSDWNYIGRLRQNNGKQENATEFLITERLEPQFRMARENGFSFHSLDQLYHRIKELIPDERPALIHGDLWNGNYLSTTTGFALIDPAVSYSLREMDLAMMQLFGGFPTVVFEAYESSYPTMPGLDERIPLYQLYFLLVHLNMFGGGYYQSCQRIIDRHC